jgi:type IV pilus assembly protein PilB
MSFLKDNKTDKQLADIRHKEAEDLAKILALRHGVEYIDLSSITINPSSVRIVEEKQARQAQMVVFYEENRILQIGYLTDQNSFLPQVINDLERKGYKVSPFMVSVSSLETAWETYKEVSQARAEVAGVITVSDEVLSTYLSKITSVLDIKAFIEEAFHSGNPHATSTVAEIIMAGAVATGVSDIHLESEKTVARLRFRIDGILQDILDFAPEEYRRLLSRIKLLAGVKLNIAREAQDGRFTIKLQGVDVEVRASFLPSSYMEGIVLRILNPKAISVSMEELGMDERLYAIMKDMVEKPNGLILTTGPTGSGKTTTLYAFLKKVRNPQVKIITIEDPVEYHLDGIAQTQVDNKGTGYRFADGLRAAMRQDPDIIMVGEIRDEETAAVAIDAALTGHLVFSTLHTNSAAGAIPRLIDLGVNPKVMGSALNIALAQRLVRKLCPFCKEAYTPVDHEKETFDRFFTHLQRLRPELVRPEFLYRPVGCDKCTLTGYKGRISIYEGILMDASIEQTIRENPGERDIREAAVAQGILDMRQDGVLKVMKGVTSLEEVDRIIGLGDIR